MIVDPKFSRTILEIPQHIGIIIQASQIWADGYLIYPEMGEMVTTLIIFLKILLSIGENPSFGCEFVKEIWNI